MRVIGGVLETIAFWYAVFTIWKMNKIGFEVVKK